MGYYQTQDLFPEDDLRPFSPEESEEFLQRVRFLEGRVKAVEVRQGLAKSDDMCHPDHMPLHALSDDEKNTLKHASLIEDSTHRVGAVLDIVQTIVDKHVAERSSAMTARFEQSIEEFVRQKEDVT